MNLSNIVMNSSFILKILIIIGVFIPAFFLIKDCLLHKRDFKIKGAFNKSLLSGIIGAICSFLDTLGIGSFGPSTALLKLSKIGEDEIHGTLNIGYLFPVCLEALFFLDFIEVDGCTMLLMILGATLGAFIGAKYIISLDKSKVKLYIAISLFIVGIIMILQQLHIFYSSVDQKETTLTGLKLVIAVSINFFLGALMMIGIGLYAPCTALVALLGLNIKCAFPIMMCSCAFTMIIGSFQFIKAGKYDRIATTNIAIWGCVGVTAAYFFVSNLNLDIISWIIITVMFVISFMMLKDVKRKS